MGDLTQIDLCLNPTHTLMKVSLSLSVRFCHLAIDLIAHAVAFHWFSVRLVLIFIGLNITSVPQVIFRSGRLFDRLFHHQMLPVFPIK